MHAPRTTGEASRRLASIHEEARQTSDDDVIDLFPKPFVPMFGQVTEPPPFDLVTFKKDKGFFTSLNPYLKERTTSAARF